MDGEKSWRNTSILVIDDDVHLRFETVQLLQEAGFEVLEGRTAEAVRLTRKHHPALVLLDGVQPVLPHDDGADILQELRKDAALDSVFVVLLFGSPADLCALEKSGATNLPGGYIKRPFSKSELLAQVEAFLRIRASQEALRDREERFSRMFRHSAAGMVLVSPDLRFLEVNPAFCQMLGYDKSELLGRTFQDFTHQADQHGSAEQTGRILSGEAEVFHFEKRYLRKDGSVVWGLVSSTLIRDALREPQYFVTQIVDITERKRAEEALRESEEQLRTILHTAMDGFLQLDLEGRLLEVNDAYCRMSGYTREELLEMRISDLEANETPSDTASHIQKIVAQGEDRFETRDRRKDGSTLEIEVSVQYRPTHGGRFVVFLRDITERKRHEAEKERLRLELAQAQKMESIGRLAGGIAHDFNNLLTVINGYAAFLSAQLGIRDPLREYALQISDAGARAASLTSQLLAFSRKQAIAPKAMSVNTVLADAERMLRRLIGEDIELVTKPAPNLGFIMADPDQIHQVILNLAVNARDAITQGGGQIEIRTAEVELDETAAAAHPDASPGRYVQLVVTDNGTGMAEEVRRNIFDPFFTTKAHGKGTGLGLATVYGIVRQNDGWIEVESGVGRGSTFRIYLPRIEAPVAAGVAPAQPKTVRGLETVLLVEDQAIVRRLARKVLEGYGYKVLEAGSGAEACAIASRHVGDIDLLLTDVVMPGMDGHALSEQLRLARPNVRVILMSGYAADVIAPRDAVANGLAYLQKPFNPEDLATTVRRVLDSGL